MSQPPSRRASGEVKKEQESVRQSEDEKNDDAATMLLQALKIGDDRYAKFAQLLIDSSRYEQNKWIEEFRPEATQQINRLIEARFAALLASVMKKMYHRIEIFIKKLISSNSVKTTKEYTHRVLAYIQKQSDKKRLAFEKRMRKTIELHLIKSDWPRDPEPVMEGLMNRYKKIASDYWPATEEDFEKSPLAIENVTLETLKNIANHCELEAAKYNQARDKLSKVYNTGGIIWGGIIEEKVQEIRTRYREDKEQLAEEIWEHRDKEIPKKNLRTWKKLWSQQWEDYCKTQKGKRTNLLSKEQLMKRQFMAWVMDKQNWVNPALIEEKTGSTLALVATKYGNERVFDLLSDRCGLSTEEFESPNHKNLSVIHYEGLGKKRKRRQREIHEAEPHHDELVQLEKAIRGYLDGWQGKKQIREQRKESWNLIDKLFDFSRWSRELFAKPFEQRLEYCDKVLAAIEEMRDSQEKDAYPKFLDKLEDIYKNSIDGALSAFKDGTFRGIVHDHFERNQRAIQVVREPKEVVEKRRWLGPLEEENKALKAERDKLRQEKKDSDENVVSLKETIKSLTKRIESLTKEKESYAKEKELFIKEKDNLLKKVEDLEIQLRELEAAESTDDDTPHGSINNGSPSPRFSKSSLS